MTPELPHFISKNHEQIVYITYEQARIHLRRCYRIRPTLFMRISRWWTVLNGLINDDN